MLTTDLPSLNFKGFGIKRFFKNGESGTLPLKSLVGSVGGAQDAARRPPGGRVPALTNRTPLALHQGQPAAVFLCI